jgi:2-polyprenyl-3-methyl-5-hydroxy-6-metoxy-1,4-benzoquinol methylase
MNVNNEGGIKLRLIDLLNKEKQSTCGPAAEKEYLKQHSNRFKATFDICKEIVNDSNATVLDIGRSPFTELLLSYYANVSTLGFDPKLDDGGHREENTLNTKSHIIFNLDHSNDFAKWPQCSERFDLITFCETIEHLHTAPEYTIAFLSSLLKPNGKLLITTPNAATLKNRITLIFGKNPFEKIRLYDKNPGHFREYTVSEMTAMGKDLGLTVEKCTTINFYKSRFLAAFKVVPSFKDSIVAVYRQK